MDSVKRGPSKSESAQLFSPQAAGYVPLKMTVAMSPRSSISGLRFARHQPHGSRVRRMRLATSAVGRAGAAGARPRTPWGHDGDPAPREIHRDAPGAAVS